MSYVRGNWLVAENIGKTGVYVIAETDDPIAWRNVAATCPLCAAETPLQRPDRPPLGRVVQTPPDAPQQAMIDPLPAGMEALACYRCQTWFVRPAAERNQR